MLQIKVQNLTRMFERLELFSIYVFHRVWYMIYIGEFSYSNHSLTFQDYKTSINKGQKTQFWKEIFHQSSFRNFFVTGSNTPLYSDVILL